MYSFIAVLGAIIPELSLFAFDYIIMPVAWELSYTCRVFIHRVKFTDITGKNQVQEDTYGFRSIVITRS